MTSARALQSGLKAHPELCTLLAHIDCSVVSERTDPEDCSHFLYFELEWTSGMNFRTNAAIFTVSSGRSKARLNSDSDAGN